MAKVYAFPMKRKLPKGMEKELQRVAREYVAVLKAMTVLLELEGNPPTPDEVMEMVADAFGKGIVDAINDLDEL